LVLVIYFYSGFIIKQIFIYDNFGKKWQSVGFSIFSVNVIIESLKGLPVASSIYLFFSVIISKIISILPAEDSPNDISIFSFNLVKDFLSSKHIKYYYFSRVDLIQYIFWILLSINYLLTTYSLINSLSLIVKVFCICYIICLSLIFLARNLYCLIKKKKIICLAQNITLLATIKILLTPCLFYFYIYVLNEYAGKFYTYGSMIFGSFIFKLFIWPPF